MSNYEDQYYIAIEPAGEDHIFPIPDQKTADRNYEYLKLPMGEKPLFFHNSQQEKDVRRNIVRPLSDVLFDGNDLIVTDSIRNKLIQHEINGLQLYPAVYIDDKNHWHENYWHLCFYERLNCLDKAHSSIDGDIDRTKFNVEVDQFRLEKNVLDAITEEKRLLFKISGVSMGYIFVHQLIVDFFEKNNLSGIRFFKVVDFEEGDQFP
ncbi:MAG: hypothetical protein JKX76_03525 [Colwellia sp.]|nr:hypothetical protein [Colwellia sp.]